MGRPESARFLLSLCVLIPKLRPRRVYTGAGVSSPPEFTLQAAPWYIRADP